MNTITITFENGNKKEYRKGIKLSEIIDDIKETLEYDIIIGKFKNQIVGYDDSLIKSGTLYLYDINTSLGNKIYEKGLIYLFISAVNDLFKENNLVKIRHSIDKGVFCEITKEINEEDTLKIKEIMKEKVKKAIPFSKIETSRLEAIEYYKNQKRYDKAKTLLYNTSSVISLYKFEGMYNYVLGELPHDTSVLKSFDLTLINGKGIVLRYPSVYDNAKIVKYTHHEKYFNSLEEYAAWGEILNITTLGELNEAIINGNSGDIIQLSEIVQDYKLLNIAEQIVLNKDDIKVVLISGPSSSGKTTTSKKLSLYLRTLGLNPKPLSIDDYYLDRKDTPIDEFGNPDYESLNAIDVKLFNSQLDRLLKGEKVTVPTYDFIEGKKIYKNTTELKEKDILVIEGLHALNEELTKGLPKKRKFKIYISPLTFLNIDNDNRISMTDIRLLRRMIRDNRTRGYSPDKTFESWGDVRKGEEKYVFPFQDEADVIFNSSLAYELGVLKTYVEPLLFSIKEDSEYYLTALRLIELLKFVLPIPSDNVPKISILREFIGNSYFE